MLLAEETEHLQKVLAKERKQNTGQQAAHRKSDTVCKQLRQELEAAQRAAADCKPLQASNNISSPKEQLVHAAANALYLICGPIAAIDNGDRSFFYTQCFSRRSVMGCTQSLHPCRCNTPLYRAALSR